MSSELAGKICTPCCGGIPPMSLDEAKLYLEQIPGWALQSEGTRIERIFTFANFREALVFVNRIGALAEAEGHHPDIRFGWAIARSRCTRTRSRACTQTISLWRPRSMSWREHNGAPLDQCCGFDS